MNDIRLKKLERLKKGEKLRVLDLFAGAGGLSLGFYTAGFDIVSAVEIDGFAAKTHALNFYSNEEEQAIHGVARDITELEPEDLLQEVGYDTPEEAIDVIIGGPPCQAFARVGRAKLREVAEHPEAFLQDARANLYLRFLHYVEKLQPLIILMENVPDALNFGGHNIAEETCEVLTASNMGYTCGYTLLNSAFYGVPQMRERMFLLAYANELGCEVEFPKPSNWIELPSGYGGSRSVALKNLQITSNGSTKNESEAQTSFYMDLSRASSDLTPAVTAKTALSDLPPLYARQMLKDGTLKRGVKNPMETVTYPQNVNISDYGNLMRNWAGFETDKDVTAHLIRFLPRDYKLFARLEPGDQYPEAHRKAGQLFNEELNKRKQSGEEIEEGSDAYNELRDEYVPPYDPSKFPNKWRKMESDQPARTLMAHIGKDSYSHIHYDSQQARTISIREAARLQSFPDGFVFAGKMNAAFRQIGNAVPPLLAYQIACKIKESLNQESETLVKE